MRFANSFPLFLWETVSRPELGRGSYFLAASGIVCKNTYTHTLTHTHALLAKSCGVAPKRKKGEGRGCVLIIFRLRPFS